MEDYRVRYQQWLEDPFIDEETKAELRGITDENEIKERFFKELEFGTGGLRGIIGNGSNRLNRYTVGKASQGLANYIKKEGTQKQGVAIAYDSRFMSPEFAEVAGLIFAANGIPAYVYPSLRRDARGGKGACKRGGTLGEKPPAAAIRQTAERAGEGAPQERQTGQL